MIQINLLPMRAERRREFIRKQLSILALSLLLSLTVMGWTYYQLQKRYNRVRHQLRTTRQQIKKLEPVIKKIEEYKQQKEEVRRKITVIIDLDRHRPMPVIILDDLNRQRPDKLWFTTLNEAGNQLTITGVAIDNETVVAFLNNLNRHSRLLKKADLTLLRSQEIEKIPLKGFTISAPVDLEFLNRNPAKPAKPIVEKTQSHLKTPGNSGK